MRTPLSPMSWMQVMQGTGDQAYAGEQKHDARDW